MTSEDMNKDMVTELSDDQLDEVVGGLIHQNSNGKWDVLSDTDQSVLKSFDNKMAAIAYAKKAGVSTKIV